MKSEPTKKPRKLKISLRKDKSSYSLEKSPLFRLRGFNQFRAALGISWNDSNKLLNPRYFTEFLKESDGKKPRLIQQPLYELAVVHNRIASLCARISVPDYIFSQRGRSYIDNASEHRGATPLIKTDIEKFFPSTSKEKVYRLFRERFECSIDIADRLADLCCYQQKHLPTGSQLSGYISYLASQPMFDEIVEHLKQYGCTPSVFVDDITISGSFAHLRILAEIRAIIRHHGFKTSNSKSVSYASNQPKKVTGSIISGERLLLPNSRHASLHKLKNSYDRASPVERDILKQELQGRIAEASQVFDRELA